MTRRHWGTCCLALLLILAGLSGMAEQTDIGPVAVDAALARRSHEAVITWFNEQGSWDGTAWHSRRVQDDWRKEKVFSSYYDVQIDYQQADGPPHHYALTYDASGSLIRIEYWTRPLPPARGADFSALSPKEQSDKVLGPIRENLKKQGITKAWTVLRAAETLPISRSHYEPGQEPVAIAYMVEHISCKGEGLYPDGYATVTYSTTHDFIERWDFPQPSMLNLPPDLQEAALQASQL